MDEAEFPWRGPYIAGMSACGLCGAMVVYDGRGLHEEWHTKHGDIHSQAYFQAVMAAMTREPQLQRVPGPCPICGAAMVDMQGFYECLSDHK